MIRLVATDIDGVWTDGGMYYDNDGNEFKKFHTYDSAGILFCKLNQIRTVILTGENTRIVERRAKKLGVDFLQQGVTNKLKTLVGLCESLAIDLSEVAYIGDDMNDVTLLRSVGISACPNSSPEYIKNEVNWVMSKNGGEGVFREFVERVLCDYDLLGPTIENAKKMLTQGGSFGSH